MKTSSVGWRGVSWHAAWLCVLLVGVVGSGPSTARAEAGGPRITSVERRGAALVVRASAPEGTVRVVLESCRTGDLRGWIPRAVRRTEGGAGDVVFEIGRDGGMEYFRVRADAVDPLPAAFYTDRTNAPAEAVAGDLLTRNGELPPTVDAGAGGEAAGRSVVESDIWVVRDQTLFFFNQYRGLQTIDVSNPDAPRLVSTFPLPGAGERMYLADARHAVLLAHDPCRQWGTDAESAVFVVDVEANPPVERARLPMKGRLVESRMVGSALYVATESWEPDPSGSGAWRSGTHVSSFDLADPAKPITRPTLWFPGSGNVVTATDRFLFVAITDYSQTWPWRSELQIVDIQSPDGVMSAFTRVPLAGHVADKFKIDLQESILRVVVESAEAPDNGRFVTVLETLRLADPRSAGPLAYARLDRLEIARGERLFGTRFDGHRAYIVTYRQVDPLWIVDLSDPTDLRIAGELKIPGWSTYLRPMGDRLLTVGIDDTKGRRVAVQLFDVGDPARPALLSKVPLGENASWSEATHDEKALGVLDEAGLVLVPVSDGSGAAGGTGVRLIDLGRDALHARGLLESADVVPRRATVHRDRLMAISGRRLVTADIADRDRPTPVGTLELSYPVDRLVVAERHLFEIQGSTLRVRELGDESNPMAVADLGSLPVLGAAWVDGRLHLLQGRGAEISWEWVDARNDYLSRTNEGVLVHSVWDGAALPKLVRLGEAKGPTWRSWPGDLRAFSLRDDLLVWATEGAGGYPWLRWGGGILEDAPARGIGGWWPGGGGRGRFLVGVTLGEDGQPFIASQTELGGEEDTGVGVVGAAGTRIFSTRRRYFSEVAGTNTVVEKVWFPITGDRATTGGQGTEGGEWRLVTNAYPVVRWWSKHQLDVVDFGLGADRPIARPAVEVTGELTSVDREGALLYLVANRIDAKGNTGIWLEAGAYDGVAVHQIASVPLADSAASETAVVVGLGDEAFVARGAWGDGASPTLERWRLTGSGAWERRATVRLGGVPGELKRVGDILAASSGGGLELFAIGGTDPVPALLPRGPQPGCLGGGLGRADGDSRRGIWLPLWDYGTLRLGP